MAGRLRVRPGAIREVGDEAAGRGPERDDNGCPQRTDCVRTVHVLKEITKAMLHALAKLRKEMTAQIPKQPRGRPRQEQQGQAGLIAQQKRCVAELFEHRYLFVRHHLSAAQQKQLRKLTYGRPELRTLRKIMEEVYRLFDRRCKTQTALKKLQRLRRRVRRFKKLGKSAGQVEEPDAGEGAGVPG